MELADYSVTDPLPTEANLGNGSLSLSEHLSASEAPADPIVHGIDGTPQNSGLELKLDLYVPAHPLIEPISPAEEQCAFPTATEETSPQPEATEEETNETGDITGFPFETSQAEPNSDTLTEAACEPAPDTTSSSDCSATLQVSVSEDPTHSNEAPNDCVAAKESIEGTQEITSDPALSKETKSETDSTKASNTDVSGGCTEDTFRKNIPPKKDKYAPLKIHAMPLSSSQLSLHCLECHIIFKDHKSKKRHIKISHPAEYAQNMLTDALFACYVCDRHFACSVDLRAHQSTHTEKERFRCPICNEAFTRSTDLTSHKKIHIGKQGYSCLECGKPCKTLTLLKYHQRVHTGDKPYICLQKHCGKRFTTPKSLLKHLDKHKEDETEGTADQKKALTTKKIKRNKGTNEWKFKCSQCDAVFKTSKTQLLHMKNKHSQDKVMESQSSIASVAQPKQPGLIITQTTAGQPQSVEAVVPIPQQIDVLDTEQIKRLIEKFENVKKVNQLVILPFHTQGVGLPNPQGLMQPLHLDFTESTVQPSECKEMDTDLSKEQNKHQILTEMEDVQQKETVGLSQEETIILSENSDSRLDTQMTPAVLTEEQTQMDVIHLELIPAEPETSVLLDQTPLQNAFVSEQAQTADLEQLYKVKSTQDNVTLETTTETTSVPLTETEMSLNVEEENASLTNDMTVSEEAVTDTLCFGQIRNSADLESDSKIWTLGQSDTVKIGEPQEPKQNQAQPDQVDSEKEPSNVEPQSHTEQHPLNYFQNNTSTVLQPKPRKKKKPSKQKVMTKPNKSKQNQSQQKSEQDKAVILSKHDIYFKQKRQDKKEKGVEGKSEVKTTSQTNSVENKVLAVPQATQTKPQKRKMKSQNNLIKKTKTVQKPQQDETLVPVQKKKQSKTSQEDGPKKSQVRKTQTNDFQLKVKKTQKNDFQIKVKKNQMTDFHKNVHKIPKHKAAKRKRTPDAPDQGQIEQQALLLLKGHKQPQLKVHKLDATELEKSPPNKYDAKEPLLVREQSKSLNVMQPKKTKSTGNKMLCGEPLSPVHSSFTSASSTAKPKILRKRKAPTKIDQEIALSPPYSRLTLGCQDCGKTFSEVSALQEHMASFHSAENMAQQDEAVDMTKESDTRLNEIHIQHNVFEIQVATDWEMGEILGDREEQRLSFPVLSPSPSLMLPSGCVEEKEREDKEVEGTVSRPEHPPEKNPEEFLAVVESNVQQEVTERTEVSDNLLDEEASRAGGIMTETSGSEVKDAVEEEIKEELSLEVNLVMVGDQSEENHSPQINASQEHETEELSNSHPWSQPEQTAKEAELVLTENVVHCVTEPEIKQEEEEVLVHRVDEQKRAMGRSSETRSKKGVGRGQGKRLVGKRSNRLNKSKKDMDAKKDSQDCQVVYQLCVLSDTSGGQDKETDKNGGNTTETCVLSSSEESPEDQVVFELDSVTTSVTEVINSQDGSFIEKSTELARDDRSPGIILEKFLTACERNVEHPNSQSQRKQANSADVKLEECSSNQAVLGQASSERSLMRGVKMFLVKAEEHLSVNEPVVFQAHQSTDIHHVSCQDKTIDHVVPLQSYSKQCIFYPVKEEEREHLVEPPLTVQKCLETEGLEEVSSGIEECDEMGSVHMEMPHVYTSSEDGDVSGEQQSTQGFLEFLSQNSDAGDSDNVHSEPEAETILMSCYHGIQNNATVHPNGVEGCGPSGRRNVCPSQTAHTEAGRQLNWKPINYFSQYFSWNTWTEIAVCTREMSKLPNPVKEKEVAQYVGIHIAMGTLKFPSTKLYWEDLTRVPLISDAMSALRFCELTRTLRFASAGGPSVETNSDNQTEETSRMFCQSHSNEEAHSCGNVSGSKTDPLWKVIMLIRRVQDGCQALMRNGSYGVDQYPLPFQRHPTHSLLHTVVVSSEGLVVDFNLTIDDSNRETVVEKMVSRGKDGNEGMVFLCKPELSTPSMLEHLLKAGVQSAGKVGGARGQIGDEFVSSDGKLKLFRCHHGFILSAVAKEKPRSTSLVSGFERAIKAANLNRDLRSLYRTPSTSSAVNAWPQSVLWDLIDLVLVNSWIQYKQDYSHITDLLSFMAFRLEVAKALILSTGVDAQDSSPPCPPAPKRHGPDTSSRPSPVLETPLPDAVTRYDGFGHWPEQLAESEEAKCRFRGCERTSRVRCLKCCVFLCISQNHNCFLKFHSQGAS